MPIQDQIANLALAYPKFFSDLGGRWESVVRTYAARLADLPPDVLEATIDELIATEEWMPSIAKIRNAAAERILALPDEHEALAQIEDRMTWARQRDDDDETPGPTVHPLVREIVDRVGGYASFRGADDAAVIRGQFGRLYREARARRVREIQVGQQALSAAPVAPQLPPGGKESLREVS